MSILADFKPLWPAEHRLRDDVASGHIVEISGGVPPKDAPREIRIRASFLRYLAVGGCDDCRPGPKGVNVAGAYIEGDEDDPRAETRGLDLEGCTLSGDLALVACRLPDPLLLRSASVPNLFLNGSILEQGLPADRLEAKGGVILRDVTSDGELRLSGALLGGNLDCTGALLRAGNSGDTLFADRLDAKGSVFLSDVTSSGELRLPGARLGSDLDCTGAILRAGESGLALVADGLEAKGQVFLQKVTVEGEVRLPGARLGSDLSCKAAILRAGKSGLALFADGLETKGDVSMRDVTSDGELCLLGVRLGGNLSCIGGILQAGKSGKALSADGLDAKGAFLLRNTRWEGLLTLAGAQVGAISDDLGSWPKKKGDLILDRFRYGSILGSDAPTSASLRLDWLALQDPQRFGVDFWPQPYEQLARVLREMGHAEDARTVLIEKERLQRQVRRQRLRERRLFEDDLVLAVWD